LIVTDKSKHSLDEVNQSELRLFEDGKPQQIHSVIRETKPVRYLIAIDASLSFKTLLAPTLEASKIVIERNSGGDETGLLKFVSSDKISLLQDFTKEQSALFEKLKTFKLEGGQSAIVDALYLAVQRLTGPDAPPFTGRRAIVLFTDGEDRRSYYKADYLVKVLRDQDVQVFVVGITVQLDDMATVGSSRKQKAEELLTRIALESGGRVLFAGDLDTLRAAAKEIAHDLHTQFSVSYEMPDHAVKNFHKVEIKTAGPDKLKAFMRPGYSDEVPSVQKGSEKVAPPPKHE
jgi:Ca-activated chloride channel family protein